ncbi:Signal transduction histidine kinase [Actinopolymorpha cephalotaxi]|uniref:Signal transduction histidine-protein kinase/phosphatase MprB n=1 Tax=Actinopolymorpha cephalotaxi TaxID=504797 RepID=A0A1I2KNW5_9ACTN|nr:HAMP domain-containing sensor histidine kinase [Actinopolymorpha cephalotaxi]NYH84572.1 signal transduction histidine kinase [Actinopolymorpha cephalotaxi]SFF68702.1 Signal transduction histidine kinase [Actinopolymorpha cephalotaxi]
MRRRLVITTVVIAVVTATLFALPIAAFRGHYFGAGWTERLTLVAFGAIAVLVAIGIGVWQARGISRSLEELAAAAERLGSGDPRPHRHRYGLPELDRVAGALEKSAIRITDLLAAERQLSQDASHQLRSPLTALSMRLEEILATKDPEVVREEAGIALGQVERLSHVVDRLLSQSRDTHVAQRTLVDVDHVVRQQVAEWRPAFDRVGRRIDVTGVPGLTVNATPGTLGHVLATLLENALHHGGGTVVVRRRTTGPPPSGSVVVEVSDAGPGVPAQLGQRVFERAVSGRSGTGLGLALARDLAEAGGGRLEMISRSPAVFAVFLPRGGAGQSNKQSNQQAGKAGEQSGSRTGDQTGEDSRGSGSPSAFTATGARKTKRR